MFPSLLSLSSVAGRDGGEPVREDSSLSGTGGGEEACQGAGAGLPEEESRGERGGAKEASRRGERNQGGATGPRQRTVQPTETEFSAAVNPSITTFSVVERSFQLCFLSLQFRVGGQQGEPGG